MIRQLISFIPCAATVFTLALVPKAQAVDFGLPTPTVRQPPADYDAGQTDVFYLDNLGEGKAAVFIDDIVVETEQDKLSYVYDACVEYGIYNDIFSANRPPRCLPTAPVLPTFLGNKVFAERAAGGKAPINMPTSDGIITALNNALTGQRADSVIRLQGDVIADDGTGTGTIVNFSPPAAALPSAYIPYAVNQDGTISVIRVRYNDLAEPESWEIDGEDTTLTLSPTDDFVLYVRFEDTGETINVSLIPEPSSVMGILAVGAFMLTKVKARRR